MADEIIDRHIFVCVHCGQPAPPEWGVDRHCPDFPRTDVPPYMRSCEFEALKLRLDCPACLFPSSEGTLFGHSHGAGCVFGDALSERRADD